MPVVNSQRLRALRGLLTAWSAREIKVRYKQSVLGSGWAIIQPLSLMVVFTVVFTRFVPIDTGGIPYPVFSYTALLPWTLLATAVTTSAVCVLNNIGLVSKVNFPREVLPMAQVCVAAFDFAVASVVFVFLLLIYPTKIVTTAWAVVPLLGIEFVLIVGLALLLSATTVRFRDIRFVVPLGLQLWMYASAVIYPLTAVPAEWQWLIRLNPMATLIEGYRGALFYGILPPLPDLTWAALVSTTALVGGYAYFRRIEMEFADIL